MGTKQSNILNYGKAQNHRSCGEISDKRKISITRFQERENSKVKFSFEIYDPILNETKTIKRIRIEDLKKIKDLIEVAEKIYKDS